MGRITRKKYKTLDYCKKCKTYAVYKCHHCGRQIDIYNTTHTTYVKYNKIHITGRCCSD